MLCNIIVYSSRLYYIALYDIILYHIIFSLRVTGAKASPSAPAETSLSDWPGETVPETTRTSSSRDFKVLKNCQDWMLTQKQECKNYRRKQGNH